MAHNSCACGVSCKKECGSGCTTKKFKIKGCITVNEEVERHEKSGEKTTNDGRAYRTLESMCVADCCEPLEEGTPLDRSESFMQDGNLSLPPMLDMPEPPYIPHPADGRMPDYMPVEDYGYYTGEANPALS